MKPIKEGSIVSVKSNKFTEPEGCGKHNYKLGEHIRVNVDHVPPYLRCFKASRLNGTFPQTVSWDDVEPLEIFEQFEPIEFKELERDLWQKGYYLADLSGNLHLVGGPFRQNPFIVLTSSNGYLKRAIKIRKPKLNTKVTIQETGKTIELSEESFKRFIEGAS